MTENKVRCIPLIVFLSSFLMFFLGFIYFLAYQKGYPFHTLIGGFAFSIIGIVIFYQSISMKMSVTPDGVLVDFSKLIPSNPYLYTFKTLDKVKIRKYFIYLKHKYPILFVKAYIVFDYKTIRDELKKTYTTE